MDTEGRQHTLLYIQYIISVEKHVLGSMCTSNGSSQDVCMCVGRFGNTYAVLEISLYILSFNTAAHTHRTCTEYKVDHCKVSILNPGMSLDMIFQRHFVGLGGHMVYVF